jgi:hypothetical protein
MERLATGVDMGKTSFVAAVCVAGQGEVVGEYASESPGFAALQRRLAQRQTECGCDVIHLVVEPTAGW